MVKKILDFNFIENKIRKKTFGIFSTIDENGHSHSTGILYGISSPNSKFVFYILTDMHYKKVKNIKSNNSVSLVIPFPHYILRFVPSSCVQFRGIAEFVPFKDKSAQESFRTGRKILKMNLEQISKLSKREEDAIFIKIIPNHKLFCYGLGFSLLELRKNVEGGSYSVIIPPERQY